MGTDNRKRCSNCGAINAINATNCVICGTRLNHKKHQARVTKSAETQLPNMERLASIGEDDLLAHNALSTPLGILVAFLTLAVLGVFFFLAASMLMNSNTSPNSPAAYDTSPTASPITPSATPLPTNTRPAPRAFPTITPLPATPTPTPTEGPCIKTAKAGDTLYGLAQQCGHRDYSIVDVILTENPDLSCAACLQEGQTINIPWPTPTLDPNATSENTGAAVGSTTQNLVVASNSDATPDVLATFFVEPTLRPGLQWHVVGENENMIIIAQIYGADAKVLSDINPEIDFAQCDFSERYGGPQCTVLLYPGQRIRVPAPTPTPMLSPTPSGSETPTPTYTPTFNIPIATSPQDNAKFDANSLVTLRWSSTGSLAQNEMYIVRVKNLDTDETFEAKTDDLFFVIPEEWQPTLNNTNTFEWTVSIGRLDGNTVVSVRETTSPRTFQWQGR